MALSEALGCRAPTLALAGGKLASVHATRQDAQMCPLGDWGPKGQIWTKKWWLPLAQNLCEAAGREGREPDRWTDVALESGLLSRIRRRRAPMFARASEPSDPPRCWIPDHPGFGPLPVDPQMDLHWDFRELAPSRFRAPRGLQSQGSIQI